MYERERQKDIITWTLSPLIDVVSGKERERKIF